MQPTTPQPDDQASGEQASGDQATNDPTPNTLDAESQQKTVSPEEQQQYDKVMTAALAQLYGDDATHNAIVQKLRDQAQSGALVHGVAHTAAMMLKSIQGNAEQSQVNVTGAVLYNAGLEIVAELCEICIAAKLVKDGPDAEQLFHDSVLEGVKLFGEGMIAEGRVSPQMMDGARATMQDQMAQAGGKGAPPAKSGGIVSSAMAEGDQQ